MVDAPIDTAELQLSAIARQLIDDIDEMYSVRLSPAQYDRAVEMALTAFQISHNLKMAVIIFALDDCGLTHASPQT